ncbi:MAG: PAS domain S-box protein, partial [Deltaproteobacteria bacterium]|nr:PAS domain S-box protein [Deltaproteobacteria bacterium]
MDPTHSCFEHILETCHDAIVVVDHQGTVLKTNPVFTKILGFSEADIQGLPFYTLLHRSRTAQQNTSRNPLINFIKTQHKGLEYFLFDKQGNSVPVHLKSILIKDDNDTPVQAIGFMTPSTQAGAMEQGATSLTDSIWETQQNYEYIFEHSPDAIALCDNTGHILMANPAFSRLLGHPPEELPGKHGSEFAPKQTGTYQTTVGEEVVITDELLNVNAAKALELYEYGLV